MDEKSKEFSDQFWTGVDEQDFDYIRSGVAFPHDSMPGCFLVGGLKEGSIKVLWEVEFLRLDEVFAALEGLHHWNFCYCRNIPENEPYVGFFESKSFLLRLAKSTEHIAFGITLINDYLSNNRLQVPKGGILEKQLQSNLEIFGKSESLHGINALFSLIAGHTTKEFFGELDLL